MAGAGGTKQEIYAKRQRLPLLFSSCVNLPALLRQGQLSG